MSISREGLVLLRDLGHRVRLGRALRLLGVLEEGRSSHARAVRLIGSGTKLVGSADPETTLAERLEREASLASARTALGEEAFARGWAEGQAMSLEQAVEYALQYEEAAR